MRLWLWFHIKLTISQLGKGAALGLAAALSCTVPFLPAKWIFLCHSMLTPFLLSAQEMLEWWLKSPDASKIWKFTSLSEISHCWYVAVARKRSTVFALLLKICKEQVQYLSITILSQFICFSLSICKQSFLSAWTEFKHVIQQMMLVNNTYFVFDRFFQLIWCCLNTVVCKSSLKAGFCLSLSTCRLPLSKQTCIKMKKIVTVGKNGRIDTKELSQSCSESAQ